MSEDDRDRLLTEYEAVRADIARRAVARDAATSEALRAQQAAHREEKAAWDRLTGLREARRDEPGDLSLVARADQAEAAYEDARNVAEEVNRTAAAIARRALEESEEDGRRLFELGMRVRAARGAPPRR
ncbi:hypothetical protein Asp14428_05130 [Actinoplanes sp. NBRC 14428]|uniref:Uncharacterized protein n=1 Tax=Pseudosporangium ferrugineum TaxID=439699 RepID=A0A2T0SHV1_9ACTN|nr:hypothetical protein [Pseudosporangium ferrugineum]PRY32990.1 hypothetical protein CLV70_101150 [Pseudosporangium ferrugineum]BCJ49038.1 hypothetical protein Asp14428_05130 [Actinoplanes sp. NBRC 14428]